MSAPRELPWARFAISGVVAYVAIDVLLVFLRPEFSVIHNAESDYGSAGHYAWLMDLNFLLRCALTLALVRALWLVTGARGRMRAGLIALAVWAVGSGLLAFFADDPVGSSPHSGHARVHLILAGIAFVAVLVGTRLVSGALRSQADWSAIAPILDVVAWAALLPLALMVRAGLHPHSAGGLFEKLFLAAELLWLGLVAAWIAGGPAAGRTAQIRRRR